MIISDLDFVEVVSEETSVVGGFAEFFADANSSVFSSGQYAISDTFTSGSANRGSNSSDATSSSRSAGFASLTTPPPTSLLQP